MYLQAATKGQVKETKQANMPELPSGITISKIKNASSATRSGAPTPETTVRVFFCRAGGKNGGEGGQLPLKFSGCGPSVIDSDSLKPLFVLHSKLKFEW